MLLGCDSTYIALSPISLSLPVSGLNLACPGVMCAALYIPHKRIAVALAHYDRL
jgi:hypothetical protein